ncbi:MAG: iron-containing alcohol dehydrogenase [Theionarchaea archaeon]|nr:iron-containing alcohol dehydrogenase [Theionarchaea archaeon]
MQFHMPTKIVFGCGVLSQLNAIIKDMSASTLLIVTDKGIISSGIAEPVFSQLENSFHVDTFDSVEPNPKSTTINAGGEVVRSLHPDLVIGMGGGSSLDAAKAVALLGTNPGSIEDYEGRQKYKNPPLPMIAIPTTCGTGSEVTWVSVITDVRRRFKMSIKGPDMYPRIALVDPDVLCSLPQPLIASTGMDALTHAVEAYTVIPRTVITDALALEAITLISGSLLAVYRNQSQREGRESMMMGSALAGMAFGNSDVGAVHCIAETIGGLYDVPHGVANSMFLPVVMGYNLSVSEERYASIARALGVTDPNDTRAARALVQKIQSLSQELCIPPFSSLHIPEDDFPEIARRSVQNNSNDSNPRKVDIQGCLEILTAASQ